MNHRPFDNDDAIWDRLVDGELSQEERGDLLGALDAQPNGWRRCALAFLEAQAWRGEMRSLVGGAASAAVEPVGHAAAHTSTPAANLAQRPRARQHGAWLAVAAGLTVAFLLGRQVDIPRQSAGNIAEVVVAPPSAPDARVDARTPHGDAITLVVNNEQGVPQRVHIPLVEGRYLGRQFAEAPQWSSSPELRKRLELQGLGLNARRRYAPMFFEQQDQIIPMVVPVDDAIVTPVSRVVY